MSNFSFLGRGREKDGPSEALNCIKLYDCDETFCHVKERDVDGGSQSTMLVNLPVYVFLSLYLSFFSYVQGNKHPLILLVTRCFRGTYLWGIGSAFEILYDL